MNMRKKILSAAVMAVMGVGTAQAVNVSTDGTGEALLFPYYTVQGGEETLLSVVNTTGEGKAVKIRFREAYNSREVLDFNIYLSPYDVWVGKVQDSADGGAEIQSNDKSCTVPLSISQGIAQPFRTFGFDGAAQDQEKDSGPQVIERVREGYVEILEMGTMDYPVTDSDPIWDNDQNNRADFKHFNGVPDNCAGIASNFGTDWPASGLADDGLNPPSGGLFGSLAVINVQGGTEISVNATALEDVYGGVQHYSTGTLNPTLDSTDVRNRTSTVFYNNDVTELPGMLTEVWGNGAQAVSAVLMAETVMNEFTINPAVDGETAWVVTFPTKWWFSDENFTGSETVARPPFTDVFELYDELDPDGQACETIGVSAYDREETAQEGSDIDFSPAPTTPGIKLCYEVNVIQFGDSNVMSAANTVLTYNNLPGEKGWVAIDMFGEDNDHVLQSVNNEYRGLPVIGFSASTIGNAQVGVGASYGTSNDHKYHRTISGVTDVTDM